MDGQVIQVIYNLDWVKTRGRNEISETEVGNFEIKHGKSRNFPEEKKRYRLYINGTLRGSNTSKEGIKKFADQYFNVIIQTIHTYYPIKKEA